ncbi:MAG: chemotaxis protein CheA [Candidatus Gastranaerophilaceae bacterium]
MELDKYLGIFIDESKENLQKLNESLLLLEKNSEDLEILNDIFRVAHTLKGMSRTMGYNDLADLTHNMENVLDPLRNGTLKASSDVINILFECLDNLEKLVEKIISNEYQDKKNNIDSLILKLKNLLETTQEGKITSSLSFEFNEYDKMIIKHAMNEGNTVYDIRVKIEETSLLPAARAYMVVNALESMGDLIKSVPSVEDLEKGAFLQEFILFIISKQTEDNISKVILNIPEVESASVTKLHLNQLTAAAKSITAVEEEVVETDKNNDAKAPQTTILPKTIRVNADRLDKLMNLVGELVINRTRIALLASEEKFGDLNSVIGTMGTITGDIQEIVMKLRMVQIEQVFNRFPRLVRDLSKKLNKEIQLKILGQETEIDRIVIEEIGDPLIHLIRNSIDHGLETAEERINAGKTAKGTIELSAFNEGDNIIIKVSDDGKGIDPENIKRKALAKGLLTSDSIKNISEKEILEYIFAPGFSTVEVATDLSGRGVGMDVVKSKVIQLGGNVGIASKVGVGTTITIGLPSTMAIVQALLIKVGEEIYATPLNYINEVIDIKSNEIKKIQNKEVIVLRGNAIPIIRLDEILEVPNYDKSVSDTITIVIVKCQGRQIGIIVSKLMCQQEVVIKPINKHLCSQNYFSGATTLGNGKVALILNINSIV